MKKHKAKDIIRAAFLANFVQAKDIIQQSLLDNVFCLLRFIERCPKEPKGADFKKMFAPMLIPRRVEKRHGAEINKIF